MNEGNSRREFSSFQNARKDAESVGTHSSATTRSGRNQENLQPTKSIPSIQCILDFPNSPSWLPDDTWNYNADTSHPSQCRDQSYNKFDETNNAWCTYNPLETRDLSPRSYDSHSSRNVVNRKYAQNSCYEKPLKFDRWVNEEPISEISKREQNFYSTQLIRQTTRDDDQKVVWIYSYKNRNLFPDESNSDSTASTDRSDKESAEESLWRSAFSDLNSSFMETTDARRQLNDRNMYNVPTHKLFERSLETVEEAESEKSRESPRQVKNLRIHAVLAVASADSVKWTDGSASKDSVNLPGEASDRKSAVYVEVHRKKETIDLRKSVESSNVSEDKKMNLADWATTEQCCQVVHQRDDAMKWKTNNVQDKCVNTDNTGQTISVPARWNLRPYSWEVYYPTSPQPDSELVSITYADTEKGMWHMLSRCFCKCV